MFLDILDVDIESRWEPRQGGLSQTIGYQDSVGDDLGILYAPISQMFLWEIQNGAQTYIDVGYLDINDVDIGQLFGLAGKATTLKSMSLLNHACWASTAVAINRTVTPTMLYENGFEPAMTWSWSWSGDAGVTLGTNGLNTMTLTADSLTPGGFPAIRRGTLTLTLTDTATGIVLVENSSVSFAWDVELGDGCGTSSGTDPVTYPSSSWTGATQPGELYRIIYTATDGTLEGVGTISRGQSVDTIQFVSGATAHAVTYLWSIGTTTGTAGITLTLSSTTSATPNVDGTYSGAIPAVRTAIADVTVSVTDAVNGSLVATYTDTVTFTWTDLGGG